MRLGSMIDREKLQAEVDRNFEAFNKLLPDLLVEHDGKYAVMHAEQVDQIFDTAGDALKYAEVKFGDGLYSIQLIIRSVADLGYFSHALHIDEIQSRDRADTS